ncbi:MAG: cobalamin biosynthesis protein [Pseudomonadota bacterium]
MIKVVALTEAGQKLGQRLCEQLPQAELCFKPEPFRDQIQQAFRDGDALIMICATGIVVRTLAEVIANKHDDPPVLVLDEAGRFVIPLLSGHEGGANELAREVSDLLQAQLVMTTANPYLRPVYAIGMGCERGCETAELKQLLERCLAESGMSVGQIASINSIDVKADEAGLIELSESLNIPFKVFSRDQLSEVETLLSTRSDYVFDTVGVYGVAESAALYAAGEQTGTAPELVQNKIKSKRATCALARAYPHLNEE